MSLKINNITIITPNCKLTNATMTKISQFDKWFLKTGDIWPFLLLFNLVSFLTFSPISNFSVKTSSHLVATVVDLNFHTYFICELVEGVKYIVHRKYLKRDIYWYFHHYYTRHSSPYKNNDSEQVCPKLSECIDCGWRGCGTLSK